MNPPSPPEDWWRFAAAEVWIPTAAEMAELDRDAVGSGAIPERALIENAGRALAHRVHALWPRGRILALAGSGHNGADALVAARTLRAWGRPVEAVRCGARPPEPDVLRGWGLELADPSDLDRALARADVVLDGILGTGVSAAPREPQATMIERVNASGRAVVAVDGPSGIDFTTGAVPGAAMRADLTVTFGWPKLGLLRFPARAFCGAIEAVEIGFPPPTRPPGVRALTPAWVRTLVPRRGDDAHKGRAGYLTLVAGRPGMAGAAVLAARAAIRAGVGIVRVVSAPENREVIQTAVPGAVFVGWDDPDAVADALGWAHAVVVGPGMGTAPEEVALARRIVADRGPKPILLDADGLNAWAGEAAELGKAVRFDEASAESESREPTGGNTAGTPTAGTETAGTLLTPHPGELARLTGATIEDIASDPLAAARAATATTGCTVLLKGTPAWVVGPTGGAAATVHASCAFAGGGMGDVLAGTCGAFLAAGLGPAHAAGAALVVSALAVLAEGGGRGVVAEDVPDLLPGGLERLEGLEPGGRSGVLLAIPAAAADPPRDETG